MENNMNEALDKILERGTEDLPETAEQIVEVASPGVDETATDGVLTKKELKAQARAERKAKRAEKRAKRTGVSFAWALILLILTNIAWLSYMAFINTPRWEARIEQYKEAIVEKDETIRRIQVVYAEREKDFEMRLTQAEENYKELNERLQRAIDAYNKYFGKDEPVE